MKFKEWFPMVMSWGMFVTTFVVKIFNIAPLSWWAVIITGALALMLSE